MKSTPVLRLSATIFLLFLTGILSGAPVGSWNFDETSGTVAQDSSGNGLNISLFGPPVWTAGQGSGAHQFNGTNFGRINNSTLLDGSDKMTISFWVRPDGLNGSAQFILSKRTAEYADHAYSVFFWSGNKLYVDIDRNSDATNRVSSQTVFEDGLWYKVRIVYDGSAHSSQRLRIYINDKLDKVASISSTTIPNQASHLYIGTGNSGSGARLKGALDDLVIEKSIPDETSLRELNRGRWSLERWDEMEYSEVEKLRSNPKFYGLPDAREILTESGKNFGWTFAGSRARGQIEVPISGKYVFWLSAKTSGELLLSSDSLPFSKKTIARLSPSVGTGAGIRYTDTNLWDQYASQMSEPVQLMAGEKYYLEVVSQSAHVPFSHIHLAWAPKGGTRTPIPSEALSYYLISPNDMDDDSLPDDWESAKGLDPFDNGFTDIIRQGESGDFDGDGLTNREEYLLGTDPREKDTDGDGISDFDETRSYRSNPLVSDLPSETVVHSVPLEGFIEEETTNDWMLVDGGLLSDHFRGSIEWEFNVPHAGIWVIQTNTRLRGTVYDSEDVDVNVSIDGRSLGRHVISFGAKHESLFRIVTPHLGIGRHTFKLDIDNPFARRTVQIRSVEVREPAGPDANSNGVPDWVEAFLRQTDKVASHVPESRVSPFCLEGNSRLASEVTVNGQSVLQGAGDSHWFVNLPLDVSSPTPYSVIYSNGLSEADTVFWQPTNVLDGGSMQVRAGDSLKLGGWNSEGDGTTVLTVNSVNLTGTATGPVTSEISNVALGTGAARFTGNVYSHISLPDSDELDGSNKLTISFRAKPSIASLDGRARGIVSKRVGSNDQVAYSAFIFTGGRLFLDFDTGQPNPTRIDTGYTMTPDWQTVTVVFDGTLASSQRVKIYVNGILKKTASLSANSIRNLESDLVVGSLNANFHHGGGPCSFDGVLDDVRICRSALTGAEVATLHGVGDRVVNTAAWFNFEDTSRLTLDTGAAEDAHHLSGATSVVYTFTKGRSYTIDATHSSGTSGKLAVTVPNVELPGPITVLQNTLRHWIVSAGKVDPSLDLQPGEGLRLGERVWMDETSYYHDLLPIRPGNLGLAARVPGNGAIAGIARFQSVAMSAAVNQGLTSLGSTELPGYKLIRNPLLVTGLPPGGKVKITIFRAGVYFEDGSTVKTLTEADFVDGVFSLDLLAIDGLEGGLCHYIDVYDAKGVLLGRR